MDNKKLHEECSLTDTDLFSKPITQTDIASSFYEEIYPVSKLNDNSSLDFVDENSTELFIDLFNSYLYLKLRIKKGDGEELTSNDEVALINYPLATIFGQIDVFLNQTLISSSNTNQHYRAYLEVLLNYGKEAQESQLSLGMYKKDDKFKVNEIDPVKNSAVKERVGAFEKSQVVEVLGRIHADIFNQDRFLLNGVPLRISFHRNRAELSMISKADNVNYKLEIVEAVLNLRKVQLTPHRFMEIQKSMEKVPALYPINRVNVITYTMASGVSSIVIPNFVTGKLPSTVVIGLVSNQNFSGDYKQNPFDFQHYNMRSIGVSYEGETVPSKKIKLDFDNDLYLQGYQSLFNAIGKFGKDVGLNFTRQEYKSGFSLFGFSIAPTLCSGHLNVERRGSLKLEIDFKKALSETVSLVAYMDFDDILTVDKFRNVLKHSA